MAVTQQSLINMDGHMAGWSKARQILFNLVKNEGTKVTDVAKAIDRSHSAVSQYISGKYTSVDTLEPLIVEYLKSIGKWQEYEDAGDQEPEHVDYITEIGSLGTCETGDLHRIWGMCRICFTNAEFGMITGNPGTGKTFALKQYKQYLNAGEYVLVTCDETSSPKSVLVDTCEALGVPAQGTSANLMRRLVAHLKKHPALIIYDEADLLKLRTLETLRALYDKAGTCGVILCGNNSLAERILVYAEERPELARLRDRVGYYQRLGGLTSEEADFFLARLNATQEARRLLISIGTRRGIRQLTKAMGRLLDVTRGGRITEDLVTDLGQIVLSFNA